MTRSNRWEQFPTRPARAADGIRARSRRGDIGESWWSRRFIEILESMDAELGGRLKRGRAYARKGQVLDLTISPGTVTGLVQGSRARPYRVSIQIAVFDSWRWDSLEAALASQALFAAKLLAGELPSEIEDVFAAEGVDLLPQSTADLRFTCSCPDWSVPCKHVAACLYLLAESFDEDPFLILQWRGREREQLLANLRAARSDAGGESMPDNGEKLLLGEIELPELADDLADFYEPKPAFDQIAIRSPVSKASALPNGEFKLGKSTVAEVLGPLHEHLAAAAAELAVSESDAGA